MNVMTALKKIDSLSIYELKHQIQLMKIEIENYYISSKNDTPYTRKRFGIPYLNRLEARKKQFEDKLKYYESQ